MKLTPELFERDDILVRMYMAMATCKPFVTMVLDYAAKQDIQIPDAQVAKQAYLDALERCEAYMKGHTDD